MEIVDDDRVETNVRVDNERDTEDTVEDGLRVWVSILSPQGTQERVRVTHIG